MTQFDKLIYEEKMEAVNAAVKEKTETVARNLLVDGYPPESVSRNTGLDIEVVEELAKCIADKKAKQELVNA